MRDDAGALADDRRLAVATAPPPGAARIHRIEVLPLQPNVAMVVVIASNGAVAKRVFNFERRLDPGLLSGLQLPERAFDGARAGRADDGRQAHRPRAVPLRRQLPRRDRWRLHGSRAPRRGGPLRGRRLAPPLGGARARSARGRVADGCAERRANLLRVPRSAFDERSVFVWIGEENPAPELTVSVVGANYGLGYRNLGTVGVLGPTRMDYVTAIASVRDAAGELSRFFEFVYEPRPRGARLLRGPRGRPGRRRRGDQEGLPAGGARAAPGREQARPGRRGEVQGGGRGA